jgi:PAS domain S-box-containing protein
MKESSRTKSELLTEISMLKQKNRELEKSEANRRRVEDELRESEEYAKSLFTYSHIPLIVMDAETGIYIDCNEAAVQIYGYATREDVLGKTPLDVSTAIQDNGSASATEAKKHIQTAREKGSHIFEWRQQRPDGQIWDADVHLMLFQHRGKSLIQFKLQDITDRKRIEAIVQKSEEKFRKIFHLSPIMIAISTMEDGRFIDVNERFLQSLVFSREVVLGKTSSELGLFVKPAQRQTIREITEEQGYAKNIEIQMAANNGQVIDCLFSAEPITINNEKCWLTVMIDVTKQKRVELALRESESKQLILLEESPDPIFSFTPEGQYKYVNRAFARGVGKPVEDIIGKRIWDVFSKDEADKRFVPLSQVFRTGKEKTIEVRVPLLGADQYYVTTITPIKDTAGVVVSAICISMSLT